MVDILDAAAFIASALFDTGDLATWEHGDFNGDGILDLLDAADFQMLGQFNAGMYTGGPISQAVALDSGAGVVAPVPEPATITATVAGLMAVMAAISRRRAV